MKIFILRFKLSLLYAKLCLCFLSFLPLSPPSLPLLSPPPSPTLSDGSGFMELLAYSILINNEVSETSC